jgi:hypothetical protein
MYGRAEAALDWAEKTKEARKGQQKLNKYAQRTQPPALGFFSLRA